MKHDTTRDFEIIARDHGAMIARITRSYESNAARAEELVQEIFVAVWQARPCLIFLVAPAEVHRQLDCL